jgi:Carboxypeptidase regulatory-like domain
VISFRFKRGIAKMGTLLVLMAFAITPGLRTISAQELSGTKGGLQGVVTDSSGAVVPGAQVTVTGNADNRTAATDTAGRWVITGLTPGPYTISVTREGFEKTMAKAITVEINRTNSLSLVLQTGAVAQTVQVDATTTSIDTGSTALSSNLTSSFYSQVPVARNVGSLFYTAPGVANSGGSGTANPAIGGATGLENQYIADGVNITDAGYGGLGVWSPIYGSLGTGLNLTFVQEVQVKTGAFEPKYGKGDGGIVQIVTKSGGNAYHGALGIFFAPDAFSSGQRYADNYFQRVNVRGHIASEPQQDASAEIGGYVPGVHLKDKLFFYGAYNPALNKVYWESPSVSPFASNGAFTNKTTVNSWAAKVTFKLNDSTSLDASAFADPSKTNGGYGVANEDTFPFFPQLNVGGNSTFSHWNFGTRSETVHLTSSLSPTWQLDISASAKRSYFTETPVNNVNFIEDFTGIRQDAAYFAQGVQYIENPLLHDYGFGIDTEKTLNFHGQHTLSAGWGFTHSIYKLTKYYPGAQTPFPTTNISGGQVANFTSNPALAGATANYAFNLLPAATDDNGNVDCAPSRCPYYNGTQVYLQQNRGIFSSPNAETSSAYHAIYANDNYALNRYVTFNVGIRWDEEQLNAVTQAYTFNDNWSPRLGINIDPFGDRKSKVFFNWGRYTQSFPQDGALRDLSNELDIYNANWKPAADANNNVIIGPTGTVVPVIDAQHLISGDAAAGSEGGNISASGGPSPIFIEHGTKMNLEEEYVGGIERQYKGFVLSARYMDRRLLRIIEDSSGASPEGALSGNVGQQFVLGNLSSKTDYFINEQETPYTYNANAPNYGAPASCVTNYNVSSSGSATPFLNSIGQVSGPGGACGANTATAADPTPDGKPDGFSNPYRHYQAIEFEANKNFSHNFLLRVNYRWAKLYGNYEGLYRNDNGQSDPSISSLYDFSNGVLGMLGQQFQQGYLNTDRRQVGNLYGSYTIPNGFMRRFTGGLGLRASSGQPISELGAHPVYDTPGEVPIGGRGSVGTEPSNYQLDLHADYPVQLGERYKVKFTFDTFNVTNSRSLTAVDQQYALSYGVNNVDYLKPESFQRAFYGRGSIRFEF